jgi:hypothetical protein
MPSRDELLVVRFVGMSWARQTRRSGNSSLRVKADKAGLVSALLTPSLECRSPRLIGESDVNRRIFERANRHRTQRFLHRLYTLLNRVRRARPEVLSIQNLMMVKRRSGLSSEKRVNRVPAGKASPKATGRISVILWPNANC